MAVPTPFRIMRSDHYDSLILPLFHAFCTANQAQVIQIFWNIPDMAG